MPKTKKQPNPQVTEEVTEEVILEVEQEVVPWEPVVINGKSYRRWTDSKGVTFTDPL